MAADARREDDEAAHKVKLLVIGDSGTGKTCLLLRYCDQTFTSSMIATIGVDFKYKLITLPGGTKLRLQIWDTAGQEKFRVITNSFYRGSMGIMLVYDVTDAKSFQNIRDNWIPRLLELSPKDVTKVLVGNKVDREDRRVVSTDEGVELARESGMQFFETSAKTGAGVDEAFLALATEVKRRRIDKGVADAPTGLPLDGPSDGDAAGGGKCPC